MKKFSVLVVLSFILACASDDDASEVAAGTAGQGGSAGQAGAGGAAGEAGAGGAGGATNACEDRFANASATGACISESDRNVLCEVEAQIDDIMQNCALGSCLTSAADSSEGGTLATCGAECVAQETEFSTECAGCFGEILACTMRECFNQATAVQFGDSEENQAALTECLGANCDDAFKSCAGVSLNDR